MFDSVRKHTKILMGFMFLLIIPSFVLFGIDGYNRMRDARVVVARVGDQDISQSQWDNAHRAEVERLRQQMPTLEAKLLDTPQARWTTLQRLVQDQVVAQAAAASHYTTSDAALARYLLTDPSVATLRGPDGKVDQARYAALAARQGLSVAGFEQTVRRNVSLGRVEQGVRASAFVSPALARRAIDAFFEQREVQWVEFASKDFLSQGAPDDAVLSVYHQTHAAAFKAPESAQIEYVVLDLEAVSRHLKLPEADVRTYFEQNQARFAQPEQRRASHILLAAAKDQPAARQAARAKAQALLKTLRQSPGRMVELAQQNSQDPGSAAKGGDLGFFGRGAMVKPFEDAAFALKKGELSEVVETDFGFHIIALTDIRAARQQSFEQARAGIEAELKAQQAQRRFADVAEQFTNLVYEQADALKPIADKLGLELKQADAVLRHPLPGSSGPLASEKLLAVLFSPEAVQKKRNTEAVEVAVNQLVAARILKHQPERVRALSEVRAEVAAAVRTEQAAQRARAAAQKSLGEWAQSAPASLPAAVVVGRQSGAQVPVALREAALRADPAHLGVWQSVDLGAQGTALLRVNRVLPADAQADRKAESVQLEQVWAAAETQAYLDDWRARLKTEILLPAPSPAAAQP